MNMIEYVGVLEGGCMISTSAFDYINVLDKAADASWTRESLITNNIANVNTPNYKRRDLNFESVLNEQLGSCKHESLDAKMRTVDLGQLNPMIYTDHSSLSYRLDGNNVDIDFEMADLAKNQIYYNAMAKKLGGYIQGVKNVISSK